MNIAAPSRMTVDEFLRWSARQESGRYELQDGWIIMQQAQNVGHLLTKGRLYDALRAAIARSGLALYALPDGATVRTSSSTCCEPDALVAPLPMPPESSLEVPDPMIVAEVLSPSSTNRDLKDKVIAYANVESIAHYLIADPARKVLYHHTRETMAAGAGPRCVTESLLRLEPPGLELDVAAVLGQSRG